MSISAECSECGSKFKFADSAAGKRTKCKNCGHPILVKPAKTSNSKRDAEDEEEDLFGDLARAEASAAAAEPEEADGEADEPPPRIAPKRKKVKAASKNSGMSKSTAILLVGGGTFLVLFLACGFFGMAIARQAAMPALDDAALEAEATARYELGDPADTLTVPGRFTVASPAKDFKWEAVPGSPPGGSAHICQKAGGNSRLVLTAQYRPAADEQHRLVTVQAGWNSAVEGLPKAGYRNLAGKQPSIVAPIPDRVRYAINAIGPDGLPVYIRTVIVFGKCIYTFQSSAQTPTDSAQLLNAATTLTE